MTFLLTLCLALSIGCDKPDDDMNTPNDIQGFNLLTELSGHWVGANQTSFGFFDWFAFDFRPISSSHLHSIYEGGTNQNIITSLFVADFEGKQQIMARNGGWLGNQYRATYFVLDSVQETAGSKYYRLVDAVGREKRAFMEFRFENDTLHFDAYKDNSGSLDEPIRHMGFIGTNYNPDYATAATTLFDFPQKVSEVDLNGKFTDLIDPDSALFLEESGDPFPKSAHGHISELTVNINRNTETESDDLLLYISTKPLVDVDGQVNFENVDRHVVRTIDINANENAFRATYLHPDDYFVTVFSDKDDNFYPSTGDVASVSTAVDVGAESDLSVGVDLVVLIP